MASFYSQAEVNFSGFASINAGKVLSGTGVPQFGINEPTFLADYPIVRVYNEDISFEPETLMGLQFSSDLTEGLSVKGKSLPAVLMTSMPSLNGPTYPTT